MDTSKIKWEHPAMWAPAIVENNGNFFSIEPVVITKTGVEKFRIK
jgi:hypothetical protein